MNYATDESVAGKIAPLFQPDILLPAQYSETVRQKTVAMPERDLMLAVLEDAVCCFQKYVLASDRRGRILFKEAEGWIFDDDDSGVFSYTNVCDVLGIDRNYLRRGLLCWKEKRLASPLYRLKKKHRIKGI